ncbi:SMI1/KNR4 family protein [Xanthocytophaga agilis]|uniref:SMI1/KNR4 family protein n=1 Tax=Xanthocytophaga agilis TaxID=3048010 RepID=A0AAE3R8X3_9BACT|nr:SMI1/KNR4 family protein [Xanthocytophaga agilis]MDJ1505415.1 SMI1/KNR4 family protein [Xanthocytophaga agilis]
MTEADIKRIEDSLRLALPEFYKTFLLNYPEDLIILGVTEFRDTTDFPPLSYSPDAIIDLNTIGWDHKGWLIVGDADCANYYFIKTDGIDKSVYLWDHYAEGFDVETESENITWEAGLRKEADSLEEFAKILIKKIVSPNRIGF